MDEETKSHLHECPPVVTVPLMLLAIPSVVIGAMFAGPMLIDGFFGDAIYVDSAHETLDAFASHWHGWWDFALHGFMAAPFWLAAGGFLLAWYLYIVSPETPGKIADAMRPLVQILENKYGFDRFNEIVFAGGARRLGKELWSKADAGFIDGIVVNGSAMLVGHVSAIVRTVQSGLLYHYAFAMILGLLAFIGWIVHGG